MCSARVAQWILSQVLPLDRAASAVGDWLEDAPQRGRPWFWACVVRTLIARTWAGLAGRPLTMTGWRLTGFALNMLIPLGTFALVMLLIVPGPGRGIDIRYRDDWVYIWVLTNTQKDPSLPPDFELSWPLALVSQLVWAARLFQTGRWIARRAPGREVAGRVAIAVAGWTAILAAGAWQLVFRPSVFVGRSED